MDDTAHAQRLFRVSIGLSAVLATALGASYLAYGSELALAHGADSVADVVTATGLSIALAVSTAPPDDDHPFGHHGAQPIAALMVAVLTAVLAVGVARESISALLGDERAILGWPLAGVMAAKVIAKGLIAVSASRLLASAPSSAVDAFRVDARNDVIVGLLSLLGFLAARYAGWTTLDAWLALPMAVLIGVSGVGLAREAIELLMGTAPPPERQRELAQIAAQLPEVVRVGQLRAQFLGNHLRVWVEVQVDPNMTVGEAHDIGEKVEQLLCEQADVVSAVAHMEAAQPAVPSASSKPPPTERPPSA